MSRTRFHVAALLLLSAGTTALHADTGAADPLRSPLWEGMRTRFLGDVPVQFDPRVVVTMPATAEDSLNVPVHVRVQGLDRVERVIVFADLNPIPKIIEYLPPPDVADFSFRFKVEQSTPVRAAALTDGRWHVGGGWLSAAGGGCTAPSQGTSLKLWQDRLGELTGRVWSDGAESRLKLRTIHPMDTGLAAGIPVFHLETLAVRDAAGRTVATLRPYEPVSENPVFTVQLPGQGPWQVQGRDTQGNPVEGWVRP